MIKQQNVCKALPLTRKFWPMFWVQFLGAFNDNVFKNALVILVAYRVITLEGAPFDSKQMVALSGGIFILPFFIFSAMAGQLSDKFSKRDCIFWLKVWEVLCMCLAAWGFFSENLILLLVTLFIMGTQSTFFGPVKYSILPDLLPVEEDLIKGNAYIQSGTMIAILLGLMVGGFLVLPSVGTWAISIAVIVIAIVGTILSIWIPRLKPIDPDLKVDWNFFRSTWQIIRMGIRDKNIFLSILGISWFWFYGSYILALIPPYVEEFLFADQHVVTFFLAVFSVGVGIGSILCSKLSFGRLELGLVPLGALGMTFFLAVLIFVPVFPFSADLLEESNRLGIMNLLAAKEGVFILVNLLITSIFCGLYIVPLNIHIQECSNPAQRSRIVASNNVLNAMFMVLSALILMVLFRLSISLPQAFLVVSIMNLVVVGLMFWIRPEFIIRTRIWLHENFKSTK